MGLTITVGILADQAENDPERFDFYSECFNEIRLAMIDSGISPHLEPTSCDIWGADGYGYSGLHALREVAGLVWRGMDIPRNLLLTGQQNPQSEILFKTALPKVTGEPRPSLWGRVFGKAKEEDLPPFAHLVVHSDAEGFYVPTRFKTPLIPRVIKDETASIWPLGSVQQLDDEVRMLLEALEVPDSLFCDSDELEELLEKNKSIPDQALWKAQPIATYSALILRDACVNSLATGAAISFG